MKRIFAFLLLLAVGFYVLHELVGDELVATGRPTAVEPGDEGSDPPEQRGRAGVDLRQGSFGATAEQRGELQLPRFREVRQPDGTIVKQMVFVLHAQDSRPIRDGMQQLDGVEATLFDDGEAGAVIRADRAFVELGRDKNGAPSFEANKEISMSRVTFEALPGSRLDGLRITLEEARALIDETELHIYTPREDVPVDVRFAGERVARLTGLGLQARLPRDRNGALQRIDVNILREPELRTAGVVARARGLLHYAENTARAVAELTLMDDVVVELDRDGHRSMTIRADQMLGWLARSERIDADGARHSEMKWRMLQLHGSPTRVELPSFRVSTPRLTVLPGLDGAPFWITASGGLSSIEELPAAGDSAATNVARAPVHGTSPRRIHLLRGREHLAQIHRAYGFPQWSIAPMDQLHVVAFESESHLEDDQREIDASKGLRVFQTDPGHRGVIAQGFGDVTMRQRATDRGEEVVATGNDGFSLVALRDLRDGERLQLELGPSDRGAAWHDHRYELRLGELEARGSGLCQIEREGEFAVVTLRSPDRDIHAVMQDRDADLSDVRWLRAEFDGRAVRAFDLAGLPARASLARSREKLIATAPRIEQTSPTSLRMLPPEPEADATLWAGLLPEDRLPRLTREIPPDGSHGRQTVVATAPRIDVHYLGDQNALIDARADAETPARAEAVVEDASGTGPPTRITFAAERLRTLPFVLPAAVLRHHTGGAVDPVALLPFWSERGAWILGDGVQQFRREVPGDGLLEGSAERLVLSAAAEAALLIGDPTTMTPAIATRTTPQRVVTARGARVRIFRGESVRLQAFRAFPGHSTFLLPELELEDRESDGIFSHVLATCRGDIDLLPTEARFGGPVTMRSLLDDGSTSPDGPGIVAQSLTMELNPTSGKVQRVLGHGVDLAWSRISGRAAEIELDARWDTLIARDPDGVTVRLADGTVVMGKRVTVNYHTLAFEYFQGRVVR